jgi:[ribosomal protein S18]-alanine N-acetyltransferase
MTLERVNVAAARQADLAAILELERSGFDEPEQWSERSWQGELLGEGRTVLIARSYHPVGVIAFQTVGHTADLHRLVVSPRHRRSGVATRLVEAGVEAVRQLGARSVILEVSYTNEPAIALYQRLGFEQLAARENYYGPGQHALILKRWDLSAAVPKTEAAE